MAENRTGIAGDGGKKQQIVLVVDGRPTRQFYTSIFLQRLHYQVIAAKTAEDALIFLDMTVPLAIITDIDLPEMSGIELLRRVKQKKRTASVPVIIYSKTADEETRELSRQEGCAEFVAYPCSLEELFIAVQRSTEERPRSHVRLDTSLEVVVGDDAVGEPRTERITDISEVGMFVRTGDPLPYGSIHTFTFYLPNAPGWMVRLEGQVQYQYPGGDIGKQPGMGVKFMNMGDQDQELIRDYVREYMMEGVAGGSGPEPSQT